MTSGLKTIIHIDFDSFFASCEQQNNAKFRNKPLAVLAANGATAIIAASVEAKKYGIYGRDRTYRAYELCPKLLTTKANFWLYFEVSKKFLSIANRFSPLVEVFSIDELFMDVTETQKLFGGVENLVKSFKACIKAEIGEYITASFGISYNKLLSKLASGINKPNGVYEITKENLFETYNKCKLNDICGIGYRIEEHLNKIGIYTLLDLNKADLRRLKLEFGNIEGNFLKNAGMGIGSDQLTPYTQKSETKSLSRQYCLAENTYEMKIVRENIFELCEEVTLKLRKLNKQAKIGGIYLGGEKSYHDSKTMTNYFSDPLILFNICNKFFNQWNPKMVRRISIWVANLIDDIAVPASLFEEENRNVKVQNTIDLINEKFGDYTIRRAALLKADKLKTVPNGFLADRNQRNELRHFTI